MSLWVVAGLATTGLFGVCTGWIALKSKMFCDCILSDTVRAVGHRVERNLEGWGGSGQLVPLPISLGDRGDSVSSGDGQLHFNGETLADASNEFNRYNHLQIQIADAALGSMRIGGSFSANDVESFLAGLQKDFGVEIVRSGDSDIVLLRPVRHERAPSVALKD